MCATSVSFKWLDILEKEFDKAFVSIDLLLGEFDVEEMETVHVVRKKLGTMCSCFSQLSHKALTIFQINCKAEAEIINLKSEIVDMKVQNQLLEKEMHSLLIQLHSNQLEQLNLTACSQQKDEIKNKLQKDLERCSPIRSSCDLQKRMLALENWKIHYQLENEVLRSTIVSLQAEVCGARLAARYLDKELAGRIQQLQLLTRDDMNIEIRNKLWDQLDAEILLQRHKTVIKVMRQQKSHPSPPDEIAGRVRSVYLNRQPSKGLGISVTGGKEHGVPILISDLEPQLSKKKLFVGDAILSVNGIDLNQLTHKDAVQVLSNQIGDIVLIVITLSVVNFDEIEEETNIPSYLSYPFFEEFEVDDTSPTDKTSNTPTAPRTPPLCYSMESTKSSPQKMTYEIAKLAVDQGRCENQLYSVTTLQNIFKNVSSIESSYHHYQQQEQETTPATEKSRVNSASSCRNEGSSEHQDRRHLVDEADDGSDIVVVRKRSPERVATAKPVSAVLSTSLHAPRDRNLHSSVISGIGDSSVGTPV